MYSMYIVYNCMYIRLCVCVIEYSMCIVCIISCRIFCCVLYSIGTYICIWIFCILYTSKLVLSIYIYTYIYIRICICICICIQTREAKRSQASLPFLKKAAVAICLSGK